MKDDITVCIPSIPPRRALLARAIGSALRQFSPPAAIAVAIDHEKRGAWHTRNRALEMANTEWIAFLDDDDEFLPFHLQRCLQVAAETNADVIVPWYDVIGGSDPVPHRFRQIVPTELHSFAITCLIRREAIGSLRFQDRKETGMGEDWVFWNALAAAGATFHQIPETTWLWHHDTPGGNTSGRPERW